MLLLAGRNRDASSRWRSGAVALWWRSLAADACFYCVKIEQSAKEFKRRLSAPQCEEGVEEEME